MDYFFKVFIEFVTIMILFYVFLQFFGHKACGILAPQLKIKPAHPALEDEVLATGPPGKFFLIVRRSFVYEDRDINVVNTITSGYRTMKKSRYPLVPTKHDIK